MEQPAHQRRPGGNQLPGDVRQIWPDRMQAGQIVAPEGMLLDGNEVQPPAVLGIVAPGLPGGEEIEPQAEAGLKNDKYITLPPASGQAVAVEKDVTGLFEPAGRRMVDVAEGRRVGRAVGRESWLGGDKWMKWTIGHSRAITQAAFAGRGSRRGWRGCRRAASQLGR